MTAIMCGRLTEREVTGRDGGSGLCIFFLKMFLFLCVHAHVCTHTCVLECVPHLAGNGFKSVKVQGL